MANKTKTVDLDLKDRKILYELDLNARQSFSEIAKKLRLSKQVVQYRINRLIEQGVIAYFYTLLDTSKLGYTGFRVYIKLQDATPQKEKEILEYLMGSEYIWWLARVEGRWDLAAMVWFKNIYEFEEFWAEFLKKYRENVREELISIFTRLYHYRRSYLLGDVPDESKVEVVSRGPEVKLDKKDWGILKVIVMNARMPSLEIGERLKLSPRVVSQRIKAMIKSGVIQGFRAMINLDVIGYSHYKVDINLHDISRYGELLRFARLHPNITYVNKTIGGSDFEFDPEVRDRDEFHRIIDKMRAEFAGLIKDYEFYQVIKAYKMVYLPGGLPPV